MTKKRPHREPPKRRSTLVDLTGAPRRVAACMNCGEVNDIAAHGMCFTCYRRMMREKKRLEVGRVVDRHQAAVRKEHLKLINGLASVMKGLEAIGASDDDVMKIRVMLDGYLAPVKKFLGGPPPAAPTWPDDDPDEDVASGDNEDDDPDSEQ